MGKEWLSLGRRMSKEQELVQSQERDSLIFAFAGPSGMGWKEDTGKVTNAKSSEDRNNLSQRGEVTDPVKEPVNPESLASKYENEAETIENPKKLDKQARQTSRYQRGMAQAVDPFHIENQVMIDFRAGKKRGRWTKHWKNSRVYRGIRGVGWLIQDKKLERTQEAPLEQLQQSESLVLTVAKPSQQVRLVEAGKNVAIVFLTCSAIYLASQVEAFNNLSAYIQESGSGSVSAYSGEVDFASGVLPVGMVAVSELEGGFIRQVGVQYQRERGEEFFEASSQLLKEALGNLGEEVEISQSQFFQALTASPSIYFQMLGSVPLSLLASWFSGGDDFSDGRSVSRLLLSAYGDGIGLYYQEENKFYLCSVGVLDEIRLESVIGTLVGSPMGFVGQEDDLLALSPFMMWGGQAMTTPSYLVSSAYQTEGDLEEILSRMGVQLWSQYPTDDGFAVRSGTDSYRFSYDGTIVYGAEGASRYVLSRSGVEISLQEQVDGCQRLLSSVLSGLPTVPEISFYQVHEGEEGGLYISFSYGLDGIPVVWDHEVVGCEFYVVGEEIRGFTLRYRNYLLTDTMNPTLPLAQVDAVLQGLDVSQGEVLFAYQDMGNELMSATWVLSS